MTILISNDGNTIVSSIAERDAIVNKFNGMRVIVEDASDDPLFENGSVEYYWNASELIWKAVNSLTVEQVDAPSDDGSYVRKNGQWFKLSNSYNIEVYDIKVTTSTSGDLTINPSLSQVYRVTSTVVRNITFTDGPSNRSVTVVLVLTGDKAPVVTGTGIGWSGGSALTDDDMGDTKTIITAFWDTTGWILSRGGYF